MLSLIFLVLLAGLLPLAVAHRRLAARVRTLERTLEMLELHAVGAPPAPMPDPPTVHEPAPPAELLRPQLATAAEGIDGIPAEAELASPAPSATAAAERETFAGLFERFVGGRLLIWVGGVALALAGVYMVRYSIEIGLITPAVRMVVAGAFGLLLVGAAEAARGRGGGDQRIAQALAGAGIFVLYAAAYGSLTLYGLIGAGKASMLMAATTAAALALALRHGAPTALIGLTGGFLTPLLVGDPDAGAVPLLGYLALLNAALFALAHRRGWTWLAAAAVALSFLWTAALLMADAGDALAAGVFVAAMAVAASLADPGGGRQLRLIQPAALGLVQLAVLVARTDLELPAWALFGALAAASLFLSTRRPEYRLLPPLALLLALILIGGKAAAGGDPILPCAAAAATLLFAGFAWPRVVAGATPLLWAPLASAAIAGPAILLRWGQPDLLARPAWSVLLAALAAVAGALAWNRRSDALAGGRGAAAPVVATAAAALLLMFAAHDLAPPALLPAAWLIVGCGLALWARRLGGGELPLIAIVVAGLGGLQAVALLPQLWWTITASLFGEPALAAGLPSLLDAARLLLLPALLLALLWRLSAGWETTTRAAPAIGALLFALFGAYVLAKQSVALTAPADFVARGFGERTLITQGLFLTGWLIGARVSGRPWAARLAALFSAVAAARMVWFDMVIHNPALVDQWVGTAPLFNLLLPAYFGSAAWLLAARRRATGKGGAWLALALAAMIAGTALMVRQLFQGALLSEADLPRGEFYGYSLAGLLLAIAWLTAGVRLGDKPLRFAGLILLTATVLKVFLVDAAELQGLLRILSFLGLGVALIGVGKLYAAVLGAERKAATG